MVATLSFPGVGLNALIPPQAFECLLTALHFFLKFQMTVSVRQSILNPSFVLALLALPLQLVLSVNLITLLTPPSSVASPGTKSSCCRRSPIKSPHASPEPLHLGGGTGSSFPRTCPKDTALFTGKKIFQEP